MILAKNWVHLPYKYSIVITILLLVYVQRIQNIPINHLWKNSSLPNTQQAMVRSLPTTPNTHTWRTKDVRRGVDIDVRQATENSKPRETSTTEDFVREFEKELKRDLSSSNPEEEPNDEDNNPSNPEEQPNEEENPSNPEEQPNEENNTPSNPEETPNEEDSNSGNPEEQPNEEDSGSSDQMASSEHLQADVSESTSVQNMTLHESHPEAVTSEGKESSLTTTPCASCKSVADENKFLRKEIETLILSNSTSESGDCVGCKTLAMENLVLKEKAGIGSPFTTGNLRPAYSCDDWDGTTRTCFLDRNIGDTVTLVLAFHKKANPEIQWAQEFHMYQTKRKKQYIIDPENPLWNIVIGSRGHEMRISPVTELDLDFNHFSATIISYYAKLHKKRVGKTHPLDTVNFKIRVIPSDLGFVYPGETLMLNMKRINIPPTNMKFKWYLEKDGEYSSLPSNMRLSPSGGVLTISELRKEQEGVLACAVFTNMGFFATKQRFLIKELNQTSNMLLYEPTSPAIARRKRSVDSDKYIEHLKESSQNNNAREELEGFYVTEAPLSHDKRQANGQQYANPQQNPPLQSSNVQEYSPAQNSNPQQYGLPQNTNEQQYSPAQNPNQQQDFPPQTADQQQYSPVQNTNEQQYSAVPNSNQQQYAQSQSANDQQYAPLPDPSQQQSVPMQNVNEPQNAPRLNSNPEQYALPQNANEQQHALPSNPSQQQYLQHQSPQEQQYPPAQNSNQHQYSPPQNPNEQHYSALQNQNQPPYVPPQNTNYQPYPVTQNENVQQPQNQDANNQHQTQGVHSAESLLYKESAHQTNSQQAHAPGEPSKQMLYQHQDNQYPQQAPSPGEPAKLAEYPMNQYPQQVPLSGEPSRLLQYPDQRQFPQQVAPPGEPSRPVQYPEQSQYPQQVPPPGKPSGPGQYQDQSQYPQQAPPPGEPPRVVQYPDQSQYPQQVRPCEPSKVEQYPDQSRYPQQTPPPCESSGPTQYSNEKQAYRNHQETDIVNENLHPKKEFPPDQQGMGSDEHERQQFKKLSRGRGKIRPKLKQKKEEIILELERKPAMTALQKAQDRLSKMIANCTTDQHCSADASCIQKNPKMAGFCRCRTGFQGSGIFCWEEIKVRNLYSKNQRTENDQRAYLLDETTEMTTENKLLFKRHVRTHPQ